MCSAYNIAEVHHLSTISTQFGHGIWEYLQWGGFYCATLYTTNVCVLQQSKYQATSTSSTPVPSSWCATPQEDLILLTMWTGSRTVRLSTRMYNEVLLSPRRLRPNYWSACCLSGPRDSLTLDSMSACRLTMSQRLFMSTFSAVCPHLVTLQ